MAPSTTEPFLQDSLRKLDELERSLQQVRSTMPQAIGLWTRHRQPGTQLNPMVIRDSLQTSINNVASFAELAKGCSDVFEHVSNSVKVNGSAYGYAKRSLQSNDPPAKRRKIERAPATSPPERQAIKDRDRLSAIVDAWNSRNKEQATAVVEESHDICIKIIVKDVLHCRLFLDKTFSPDHLIIQGIDEKIPPWEQSSHHTFQCIARSGTAKIDDGFSTVKEESMTTLEDLMDWIASFTNLLSLTCDACKLRLRFDSAKYGILPPIERQWLPHDKRWKVTHLGC